MDSTVDCFSIIYCFSLFFVEVTSTLLFEVMFFFYFLTHFSTSAYCSIFPTFCIPCSTNQCSFCLFVCLFSVSLYISPSHIPYFCYFVLVQVCLAFFQGFSLFLPHVLSNFSVTSKCQRVSYI